MLRLFNANLFYTKVPIGLYNSAPYTKKHLGLYFNVSIRFSSYSALPQQKMIFKSSSYKKRVKLKVKPYEELLKVLEVREQELKNRVTKSSVNIQGTSSHSTMHLSRNLKPETVEKISPVHSNDLLVNEGIYSVKSPGVPKRKEKNNDSVKESSKEKKKKKSKGSKSKAKSIPEVSKEKLEKLTKHKYAMRALKSYIEISINAEEVDKAHEAFEYNRTKSKLRNAAETFDVELYNALIYGWAKKGRLDKVKYIFSLISTDGIAPNLQSYVGYLECLSRSKFIDVLEVHNTVKELKSNGYSLKDILKKCIFVRDQREKILEVLGYVESDLSLPSYAPKEAYSCTLLTDLNDRSCEKGDNHPNFCFQSKDIRKLSAGQIEAEDRYSIKIKSVDSVTDVNDKVLKSRKYLKELEEIWRETLTKALQHTKNLEKKAHGNRPSIYPYLAVIDTEILVNLLIQEIRMLAETGEFFSPNVKALYKDLGIKVMNQYFIWLNKKNQITDKVLLIYQKYLSYLLDPNLFAQYSPREYWEFLKNTYLDGPTIDISNAGWPPSVLTYIGKYMYDILQTKISFNANRVRHKAPSKVMSQAFYTTYEGLDVKLSRQIRTHALLCKLYREAKLEYLEFDISLVPMLCPPRPWVKFDAGGLLISTIPLIRFPDKAQHQTDSYSKVPPKQLNPCLDSLNSLSLCPWKINKPILDLVIAVFQKGGSEELDIPLNPSSFSNGPKIQSTMTKKEKNAIRRQKLQLKKQKCEMTSLWFDCLYKLSIANHFRDRIFWFPHNLDFRGRVYPTPPHFNHLGSDMARSILLFADGKPLGKNGLNWLKMHLINLTGFKKRDPHAERLKYADEMMPEILDSADRPFDGNQWWKTSDKPWQTLACCKEVAQAIRHPNPEEYVSYFPVHQDGSCNGLQHYAALGRDELGAIEVNLHPSDLPHDVYSGVAAMVEKERQKDAESGMELAQSLEGIVRRKVVKQTVMTFVYGVTNYGAKLQILKQLKAIPELPEKCHHEGATYLMKKTFLSIREMFTATKQIQDWFTVCAEHITKVSGDTLEWVTPLGLPVSQPYFKEVSVNSPKYSIAQREDHYMSNYEPYQLPNIKKQKNAFAPNFIHSLDSSHMMLTSLFCQRHGITFVSVHDCFWTHACSVDVMNKICRQQFVSLHSEPILENLSAFFLEKYAKFTEEPIRISKDDEKSRRLKLRDIINKVPKKGTFDLKKVLESEYFFS